MCKRIPSSYYIGQEFVEDKTRIEVDILYSLYSNVYISNFQLNLDEDSIKGIYSNQGFIIQYERKISEKLFNSICNSENRINFLYGYFGNALPLINEELSKQKYLNGQILSRPVSCFDIKEITLLNKKTNKIVNIDAQIIVDNFPKSKELAKENDSIFIRDFADAITSNLYCNYDDCIRKLITSLENFFELKNFKNTFNMKLDELTSGRYTLKQWESYMSILNSNMKFIYKMRNNIVHDELRIKFDKNWSGICHTGIRTLSYLYQNSFNSKQVVEYIMSLISQYLLIHENTSGTNLDKIENENKSSENKNIPIIKSPSDLDAIMFNGLKIPESIKSQVLTGK